MLKRTFLLAVSLCIVAVARNEQVSAVPEPRRRSRVEDDVAALRARLARPRNYLAEARVRDDERMRIREGHEKALDVEAVGLLRAMRAKLSREVPANVELGDRLDIAGLARFIVRDVDRRHSRGDWLPMGRQGAPFFLTSVAFFEGSWRWRNVNLRGSRGERSVWQTNRSAWRWSGHTEQEVATDPVAALDAAINVMRLCAEKCSDMNFGPRAMGCYASAGVCGAAPDVVRPRFALAEKLRQDSGL